jgi:hypothetical protein
MDSVTRYPLVMRPLCYVEHLLLPHDSTIFLSSSAHLTIHFSFVFLRLARPVKSESLGCHTDRASINPARHYFADNRHLNGRVGSVVMEQNLEAR